MFYITKIKILKIFFTSLILFQLVPNVFAESTGATGMNFLKIVPEVRGIGMGEASVAAVEDVGAVFWNPAGLADINSNEAVFMYNNWFEGIRGQYVALAVPVKIKKTGEYYRDFGVIAGSVQSLTIDPIQGYNADGEKTSKVDAGDILFSISYAKKIYENFSAGITLKHITEMLANEKAVVYAGDIGLMFKSLTGVSMGFAIQNIGTPIKFIKEKASLPLNYKTGVAYSKDIYGQLLTVALDLNIPNDNDKYLAFGAEYWIKDVIAFRCGYKTGDDIGTGLRGGLGFKNDLFKIDYAFAGFGDLGDTHRVSFGFCFGKYAYMNREEKIYQKSIKNYEKGNYLRAVKSLNKVLISNPSNKKALTLLKDCFIKLNKDMYDLGSKKYLKYINKYNLNESSIQNQESLNTENLNTKNLNTKSLQYKTIYTKAYDQRQVRLNRFEKDSKN